MEGGSPGEASPAETPNLFSLADLGVALRTIPETPDPAALGYLQLPWQREHRVCKIISRRRRDARLHRKGGPLGKEIHGEGLAAGLGGREAGGGLFLPGDRMAARPLSYRTLSSEEPPG